MLRSEQYASLYAALLDRNVRLINDPAAYRHCHELPESYECIAKCTPGTVWLPLAPGDSPSRVQDFFDLSQRVDMGVE
jgi:hypothetical protein